MDDKFQYATNYKYRSGSPLIRDRTHHKIRERDARHVTAECGTEFRVELYGLTDEPPATEQHNCGLCFD